MSATTAPVAAPEETVREEVEQEQNQEREQKETEGTKAEELEKTQSASESRNATEGVPYSARVAERIRQSERLPAGLRTRLAELIEAQDSAESIEAAIRAVEEALPGGLRIDERYLRRPEHPGGEAFFRREPGELTDDEAERIAREQLARAGLLRGQRVRVGD